MVAVNVTAYISDQYWSTAALFRVPLPLPKSPGSNLSRNGYLDLAGAIGFLSPYEVNALKSLIFSDDNLPHIFVFIFPFYVLIKNY